MIPKKVVWNLYGLSVLLASLSFMAYVFVNETFFGRGVLFYEPSRPFAGMELALVILGGIFVLSKLGEWFNE